MRSSGSSSRRVIDEVRETTGRELVIPATERTGKLQTSAKVWAEHAHLHPFLESWLAMKDRAKLCQFFAALQEPIVHPRYRHLLRTGPHGLQQAEHPADPARRPVPAGVRAGAGPPAAGGRLLVHRAADPGGPLPEGLRPLELANVIRAGRDPHAHTAAMIVGVPYEEFLGWKDDETVIELNGKTQARKHHFKEARQLAKPINFGVPGGLGAASLVAYARHTYKVDMTPEQAGEFKRRLIEEIYPELSLYLDEDGMSLLAHNLGRPVGEVWSRLRPRRDPRTGTSRWGSATSSAARRSTRRASRTTPRTRTASGRADPALPRSRAQGASWNGARRARGSATGSSGTRSSR